MQTNHHRGRGTLGGLVEYERNTFHILGNCRYNVKVPVIDE